MKNWIKFYKLCQIIYKLILTEFVKEYFNFIIYKFMDQYNIG